METTLWFDRRFDFNLGPAALGDVCARLRVGPESLERLTLGYPNESLEYQPDGKWSVKEHIGHLSLLEPLWRVRFGDIVAGRPVLSPADLDNKATTSAGFNRHSLPSLLASFRVERAETVAVLEGVREEDQAKTSLHPRLNQPMRIIDLAYFVAEHDRHHEERIRGILG